MESGEVGERSVTRAVAMLRQGRELPSVNLYLGRVAANQRDLSEYLPH